MDDVDTRRVNFNATLFVGGMDLAECLLQDQKMCQSKQACAGLADIKLLFSYLELFQVTDKVRQHLSILFFYNNDKIF